MVQILSNCLDGFATWNTPVSFLAGIGASHLYCKYWRDRKGGNAHEKR